MASAGIRTTITTCALPSANGGLLFARNLRDRAPLAKPAFVPG
jgi:hypothetical protein